MDNTTDSNVTQVTQQQLIEKLLASFNEAAFICYHGELWMNDAMSSLLGNEKHSPLNAVVPSNLHQLLSQPGSKQFTLEQIGANKVSVDALITPYQLGADQATLGIIINQLTEQNTEEKKQLNKISILSSNMQFEKNKASVTLEAISDGIISIDQHGLIDYMNSCAELMTGVEIDDAIDKKLIEVLLLEDANTGMAVAPAVQNFKDNKADSNQPQQLMLKHKASGYLSPVEIHASAIKDNNDHIEGSVLVIHDISDLHHMSEQIIYQAKHDSLTGLYNRGEFERQLEAALSQIKLKPATHVMCYIDLDQFKTVNDTCGHLAGDELLRQISAHIKSHTKDRDLVGRLGGDEFGLLLRDCDLAHAKDVTERIRQSVKSHRFEWDNKTFYIGASIGVMAIDENAGTRDDVLSTVDSACYNAKKSGRDQVNFITETNELIQQRHSEAECVEQIKHALQHDCFQLYSQPITGLDAEISNSHYQELLLRMQTKKDEILEPGDFISTALRYHMMPDIDRWVIQHALTRLSDSEDPLNDENIVLTCINISSQSLNDSQFVDDVINYFKNSLVSPNKICFEISEAAVASNISHATDFMLKLSAIGIHFSLDNFCNSLSSFSYLKKLPVDFLKIDGRFMHNMIEDEVDSALISAIRDITNILGIQTIAECVEDQYTFNALKTLGIDYAQGYFISPPKNLLQQYEQSLSPTLNIH